VYYMLMCEWDTLLTPPEGYTAKTLYRKFETKIPRNETAPPLSQFLHSCSKSDLEAIFIFPGHALAMTQKFEKSLRFL
jgi:hypothetical protein